MSSSEKNKELLTKELLSISKNRLTDYELNNLAEVDLKVFFEFFFQSVSFDYLLTCDTLEKKESLCNIALIALRSVTKSNHNLPSINFTTTKSNTILTIVGNDVPYIVESITIALQSQGFEPELFIHPVIDVLRNENGCIKEFIPTATNSSAQTSNNHKKISLVCIALPKRFSVPFKDIEEMISNLYQDLNDVFTDHTKISKTLESISENYSKNKLSHNNWQEIGHFIKWLLTEYYIVLGSRYYPIKVTDNKATFSKKDTSEKCLGLFKNKTYSDNPTLLIQEFSDKNNDIKNNHFFSIQKTSLRSTIKRPSRLDVLKIYNLSEDGIILGVYQIIGLFSKRFYKQSPFGIPLFSSKANRLLSHFNFDTQGYDNRLLKQIINSVPLDEFFQLSSKELSNLSEKVLNIHKRLALVMRTDHSKKFISILVFLPRHQYSQNLQKRFSDFFTTQLKGCVTSKQTLMDDSPFARMVFVINTKKDTPFDYDIDNLEKNLNNIALSWQESFLSIVPNGLYCKFPITYQESYSYKDAVNDYKNISNLTQSVDDLHIDVQPYNGQLLVSIYRKKLPLTLSKVMPLLESIGLRPNIEHNFEILLSDSCVWLHRIECETPYLLQQDKTLLHTIKESLISLWADESEPDFLDQLVCSNGLSVRKISLIKTFQQFLKQTGQTVTREYLALLLKLYPEMCTTLLDNFDKKHNPHYRGNRKITDHNKLLENVENPDHDKTLRQIFDLSGAIVRTNYYQTDKAGYPKKYISIKIESGKLDFIPIPKPRFEIFVSSPWVEGVHLRGGKVARGGLRWSDRANDFRFEILGLMKAQMTKNAIIVPVGSKGGFYVKNYNKLLANGVSKEDLLQEVIRSYQTFIRGLLDITDNLVKDRVVPPQNVVRHDEDDTYLVVAADKGTATFSDIANEISQEYNFWLGDAFASGGSNGYDHKKLGITARGAWVSIWRHFIEMDKDIYKNQFDVIGIGDMSGDVFGNGMMTTPHSHLIAAFDHRDIFIDPTPNTHKSFEERKRLFNLPRSSWQDFNKQIISKGGGVFSRSEKNIKLSDEVKQRLKIAPSIKSLTPNQLIQYILKAQVDLLWFGGIGTYIKSERESDADVSDRANDAIRINASQLSVKVIGEGANLGCTQLGRIEFAEKGGRVNTDFIDNSAGVDCSDHEVNIKILLNAALQSNLIDNAKREEILSKTANAVCEHALRNNFLQTQVISIIENFPHSNDVWERLMINLEKDDFVPLNRIPENLPSAEEMKERDISNKSLTNPEVATLLAYSKLCLYRCILFNLSAFNNTNIINYFPKSLQKDFSKIINDHPLKDRIFSTIAANQYINRLGPFFMIRGIMGDKKELFLNKTEETISSLKFEKIWQDIESNDQHYKDRYKTLYQSSKTCRQIIDLSVINNFSVSDNAKPINHALNKGRWLFAPTMYLISNKIGCNHALKNEENFFGMYKSLKFSRVSEILNTLKSLKLWQYILQRQLQNDWIEIQSKILIYGSQKNIPKDIARLLKELRVFCKQSSLASSDILAYCDVQFRQIHYILSDIEQ